MADRLAEFILAPSVWPRQGGDAGNRSLAPCDSAARGRICASIELPVAHPEDPRYPYGGVAVLPDGTMSVVRGGVVTALTADGTIRWRHVLTDLRGDPPDRTARVYYSPPVALTGGDVVVSLPASYVVLGADGVVRQQEALEGGDDSGCAPNVTPQGALVLTSMFGGVTVVDSALRTLQPGFGYDLVPPAVYADGSLAVGGYSGTGFCRVETDGRIRWRTDFIHADLLPTVDDRQVAAVGALDDGGSRLFTPSGQPVGTYGRAAVFAVYGDTGWMARSKTHLARLDSDGRVRWEQALPCPGRLDVAQPLVDAAGRVYATAPGAVTAWDAAGHCLFDLTLPAAVPGALAVVAPGILACLAGERLVLID